MKKAPTFFLRTVLCLILLILLALCVFAAAPVSKSIVECIPDYSYLQIPILIGIIAAALPVFFALFECLKLLGYIDKNTAFSVLSVRSLKKIKFCALICSIILFAFMPVIFLLADADDAPGLVFFFSAFAGSPLVLATVFAVLERLLGDVIKMKQENDLTI